MGNFNEIINSHQPVLIDFYADWCGPCKMMPPILKEVKESLQDKVRILKINVDKNQAIAARFNVRSIPTLMLFKQGEIKWSEAGVVQAQKLKQIIESNSN